MLSIAVLCACGGGGGGNTTPPPFGPLAASPSASGTTIPTATQIVDNNGTVWTLSAGVIYRNGVADTGTANVSLLLWYDGTMYEQAAGGAWSSWNGSTWNAISGDPRATTILSTNFGMHENELEYPGSPHPYPAISFGTFRQWDVDQCAWPQLEPSRGTYNWSCMDDLMGKLSSHGQVLGIFTMGYTPCWANAACSSTLPPDNQQDYIDFVTALATRYKGKILRYETWNEVSSKVFWTGTDAELSQLQNDLWNTVKKIDPGAGVSTPSYVGGGWGNLNSFLSVNGTANFDAVDLHLYPLNVNLPLDIESGDNNSEAYLISQYRNVMASHGLSSTPIYNTEFSWGTGNYLPSSSDQVAYVGRSYLYFWSHGIKQSYWYSYDNDGWGELWTPNSGPLTAAGIAYQQVYQWMVGATMNSACAASGTVWSCGLLNSAGQQTMAVWNTAGSSTYSVPSGYGHYRDLAGNTNTVSGNNVTIGRQPILLVP